MNAPLDTQGIAKTLGLAESTRRGRALRRGGVLLAVVLLLAVAVLFWGARGKNASVQYQTAGLQRGALTVSVTATGNLAPTNQVDVGVEVSGTVASVDVDYNDPVQVGQVLARLDTSRLEAEMHKSQASLEAARAKVAQTLATQTETHNSLTRLQRMFRSTGGKLPAQQDLDTAVAAYERAQTDVASARASVAEAEATLKADQTDLGKAVIRSPINGIVLTRSVEPGQTLAASFQSPVLFTLAEDLTKMELDVDVDEADVGQVRAGQPASFTVDAYPDRRFEAKVQEVHYGSKVVDNVVTYQAVLEVDNSAQLLRPGMTATADITVAQIKDALLVPNAALRFTPPVQATEAASTGSVIGKILPHPPRGTPKASQATDSARGTEQRVWVLRDGQPQAVAIKVGATNGLLTEVLSGPIEPGMAVITDVLNPAAKP